MNNLNNLNVYLNINLRTAHTTSSSFICAVCLLSNTLIIKHLKRRPPPFLVLLNLMLHVIKYLHGFRNTLRDDILLGDDNNFNILFKILRGDVLCLNRGRNKNRWSDESWFLCVKTVGFVWFGSFRFLGLVTLMRPFVGCLFAS